MAHQEVDGEVIAIDFVSGAYFSMQGTAAEIWQMLSAGDDVPAIAARYRNGSGDHVDEEIKAFVSELVAANLIAEDEQGEGRPVPVNGTDAPLPYSKPQLEKFEDMADLIMLDPVHDVSGAGWPYRPGKVG